MDGTFYVSSIKAKLGVVCRDSSSNVRFCANVKRNAIHSPLQAELMAIFFGLDIVTDKGYKALQIEIDFLLAVKEIAKGSLSMSE